MTYDEMYADFKEWKSKDSICTELWNKIENGISTFEDAERYSKRIAQKWSEMLQESYGEGAYEDIIADVEQSLKKAYSNSAYYAKNVMQNENELNGIGIKALEPKLDEDRLRNFIETLEGGRESLLDVSAIGNVTRLAVTDTIEYNARVHNDIGLYSYIIRDAGKGCCDWCNKMAGTYEYGEQPPDFFKVHSGCICSITYKPSKKPIQKIKYVTNNGIISKVTKIIP